MAFPMFIGKWRKWVDDDDRLFYYRERRFNISSGDLDMLRGYKSNGTWHYIHLHTKEDGRSESLKSTGFSSKQSVFRHMLSIMKREK